MTPDPYSRLKRMPPMAQPQIAPELPQMQPAPQGMPMQQIQGVGGETEGDFSGFGDIAAALTGYLKKRQGDSAAGAKAAFEAGGSL